MNGHSVLRGLLLLAALATWGNVFAQTTPEATGSRLNDLPLAFVENQGQWEDAVRFSTNMGDLAARFEAGAVVLCRRAEDGGAVVRFSFEGASDESSIEGESPLPGVYNFFIGDSSTWRTGVRGFEGLLYRGLYDGVDLRIREQAGRLKYDVLLERAADLESVLVHCDGVDDVEVDEEGNLVLATPLGELIQPRPETWQVLPDGERKAVECRYRRIDESRYGFEAPDADPTLALVVDPGIDWSTFIGGSAGDWIQDVVITDNGTLVGCGRTYSSNFPTTTGAFQTVKHGSSDAFVIHMDPSQTVPTAQLVYATYLGGSGNERAVSLDVDDQGVITVVGFTSSTNYPVTPNAYDRKQNGSEDVFVSQLNPSKTGINQLEYSTYVGGQYNETGHDLHVSDSGIITVVGRTQSPGFPVTPNAYGTTLNGGMDLYVLRLDPETSGSAGLLYSTFVGGSGNERTYHGTHVDESGVVTVAGRTSSPNFPTKNAYQASYMGGHVSEPWDAFVVRIDPSQAAPLNQLVYGTYLGGPESEFTFAATVDSNGDVIVASSTISGSMPTTTGAYQPVHANPGVGTGNKSLRDCHVARLDPTQSPANQLVAATFLGGSTDGEVPLGVVVDGSGNVIVAGQVSSTNFPITAGAFDATYNGGFNDSFVARLDRNLERLFYSTYIGGSGEDNIFGLVVDEYVAAVVPGGTWSTNFPTTAGTSHSGAGDGFLTRLDLFPTGAQPYGDSTPGCHGPIAIGVNSMPYEGNHDFRLLCVNAPPSGTGYLLVSLAKMPGAAISAQGVDLWVPLSGLLPLLLVKSDDRGYCEVLVPLPAGTYGYSFCAQFAWLPNKCGPQQYSASNAVEVTIQ